MCPLTTTHTVHIKNDEEAKMNTLNIHKNATETIAQSRWLSIETHLSCHSGELSSSLGNDIKVASICMIEVSPKVWRPKQENKYRVPYYSDGVDDGGFYYKVDWKSLCKPNIS